VGPVGLSVPDTAVAAAVTQAHRHEWAFVLAATARVTADLDVAEECVQHAYAQALTTWAVAGVPARPGAWLTTVARRHAVDRLRREATIRRSWPLLVEAGTAPPPDDDETDPTDGIGDDRLRLIFTCCHPALALPTQVALTLRLVCGLSTGEVARSFLVSEPTMAARITRAKKKIAGARIPYRVPGSAELPARIDAVLEVVHLVFTTGHTAPAGDDLIRRDLVERSVDLTRMLRVLLPDDPGVAGLLALIRLTDARSPARLDNNGGLVLLADQDRSKWDQAAVAEGLELVRNGLGRRPPNRFALMAAIAAVHSGVERWADTDWSELVCLYDLLLRAWPSPVVALNRAVAVGMAAGPEAGLAALDALADEPRLAAYPYFAAARADTLRRLDRRGEARRAYEEALALSENRVERTFLLRRLAELAQGPGPG
jgi:RNA polymerase sigma factor (sigma-70 family)